MYKYQRLNAELGTLVVLRDFLDKPLIKKLRALFACEDWDKLRLTELYCDFAHELYKTGESLSQWMLDCLFEEENIYVKQIIEGRHPGKLTEESLIRELAVLEKLTALDCDELLNEMNVGVELPRWTSQRMPLGELYKKHLAEIPTKGYGVFARYHMFTLDENGLVPVRHPDPQRLDELYGYENERNRVIQNTLALLEGRPANNVLLYGDAGTGKSSTVKAVANELYPRGLRLIEVKKNQLYLLPALMDSLEGSPLKYIIFIDDLSFDRNDGDFAALKAILEGSVSTGGANVAVYATSNRRHLVKETQSERQGDDIHISDTLEETQSLSARFGLTITFVRPDKDLYCEIVQRLAAEYDIVADPNVLAAKAEAHAIRSGGRSPRTAKQFIEMVKAGVVKL